ncbi:VOC family protein [Paenibacillus sp. L3-i20]|uniref:VOC family protein n=1 Tax=Paenibacillus sp. L3-i20 TaxID=2905833 RepID=UPI0020BD99FC|nr:VOC family protein [Paenibacillus sp. L3-i20]
MSNLEESTRWYVDVFGCVFVWKEESGYAALNVSVAIKEGKSANIELGHAMITLVESEQFSPLTFYKNGELHPYMNFYTKDIEHVHQLLTERGVEVEPISDEGNLKYFNFIELNGHHMGVCSF